MTSSEILDASDGDLDKAIALLDLFAPTTTEETTNTTGDTTND